MERSHSRNSDNNDLCGPIRLQSSSVAGLVNDNSDSREHLVGGGSREQGCALPSKHYLVK